MLNSFSEREGKLTIEVPDIIHNEQIPKIGAVIVNYNNFSDTIKYVNRYLLKQLSVDMSIVIVDNHSPNDSFARLEKEFSGNPGIRIILNDRNIGYSGGINTGIHFLEKSRCDYILVTNNDIELYDVYLLYKLAGEYSKLNNIAFISPLMLVNGAVSKMHYAWKLPDKLKEILSSTYFLKSLGRKYLRNFYYDISANENVPVQVDCLPGSFFMGSCDSFNKAGALDENIFLYYEETLLGKIIKDLNMNNYLVPGLKYNHFQEYSVNTEFSYLVRHRLLLDSKLYYWKHYAGAKFPFLWLLRFLFYINVIETIIIKPGKVFHEKTSE